MCSQGRLGRLGRGCGGRRLGLSRSRRGVLGWGRCKTLRGTRHGRKTNGQKKGLSTEERGVVRTNGDWQNLLLFRTFRSRSHVEQDR